MKELSQRLLGPATIVTMALTIWLGIWVTPPDKVQGNLARLLYVHPAIATVALYLSFGTATIASALYLWRRTRSIVMDRVAHCAMEVSLVFIILTLITGSIWGRPAWGVWWAWDARLTSTAILGVLALGYLALRRSNDDFELRARRSAVFAILAAINVPIDHFSVQWWHTLHQGATLLPILSLPAFAPLLLAGERSFNSALHGGALLEWWIISVVALAVYLALGILLYGVLEES